MHHKSNDRERENENKKAKKKKKKEPKPVPRGRFGQECCRTWTCALLCMKSRSDGFYMQENIHPFGASVRTGEKSGGSVELPSTVAAAAAATTATATAVLSRCICISTGLYFFDIEPRRCSHSVRARNCATSGSLPYRRYVVANLRALAI